MTPEIQAKVDAIKAKYNYQPPAAQKTAATDWFTTTAPKKAEPSYLQRVQSTMEAGADAVGGAFKTGAENVTKDVQDYKTHFDEHPEYGLGRQVLHGATALADLAGDVAGTAIGVGMGALKAGVAPISQKKTQEGDTIGQRFAEPIKKTTTDTIEGFKEKNPEMVAKWESLDPTVKRQIENLVNVLGLTGGGKILGGEVQGVKGTLGTLKGAATDATKTVSEGLGVVSEVPGAILDRANGAVASTKETVGNIKTPKFFETHPKEIVKTTLQEMKSADVDRYATIAQDAVKSAKNPTPLEHAGIRAQEALGQMKRKLSNIGASKRQTLEQAAVGRKPVGAIAVKFRQDLQNMNKIGLVEGDTKLLMTILGKAKELGNNPTAKQVDHFIDGIQNEIYSAKRNLVVPVSDAATAPIKRALGQLNESLKNQLPDSYRSLNQKYANMIDDFNELNIKLGAEGEKGGALMKRVFSPSDANTKQLFARIKQETGIDLTNEAVLARYMMEVFKDTRGASMLDQLGIKGTDASIGGIVGKGWDWIKEQANTPAKQVQRAKEMTKDYLPKRPVNQPTTPKKATEPSQSKTSAPANEKTSDIGDKFTTPSTKKDQRTPQSLSSERQTSPTAKSATSDNQVIYDSILQDAEKVKEASKPVPNNGGYVKNPFGGDKKPKMTSAEFRETVKRNVSDELTKWEASEDFKGLTDLEIDDQFFLQGLKEKDLAGKPLTSEEIKKAVGLLRGEGIETVPNVEAKYIQNKKTGKMEGKKKVDRPLNSGFVSLTTEAQKYETVEEFVKAQQPVYHGSTTPLKSFSNKKGGVFFTDNMEDASGFAGNPDYVYEGYLSLKKPLVIDAKGAKWDELNTKYGKSTQEVISNAEKDGYDGVTFKNIVDNIGDTADWGGQSTIHYVYKPQDSFINESQLTDIWNKAHNKQ